MNINKIYLARLLTLLGLALLMALGSVLVVDGVSAGKISSRTNEPSPLHPTFPLLDANGENVLSSGNPVSTMKTCGECHDVDYIASHNYHADLGLKDYAITSESLDSSPGMFGRWDPLSYRFLSHEGDQFLDLGTPEWLMKFGARLTGGGPGVTSRYGQLLTDLEPSADNPETSIMDNETGKYLPWYWEKSGTLELNCFLCHLASPDNESRIETIENGKFGLASTATLQGLGVVEIAPEGPLWNPAAFDRNGALLKDFVQIQDPSNENCALCHGVVHADLKLPLVLEACTWETATTGQVISPQRISYSGMNIADKAEVSRSWDIHAERELSCVDCHFSVNNPVHVLENSSNSPGHLIYDPRRLDFGEYLSRPNHNFARGQSAQYTSDPETKASMRRCDSCHDPEKGHSNWLPYVDRHMQVVACETCHIPEMYAPALQQYDWTVLRLDEQPQTLCRGIELDLSGQLIASTGSTGIPPSVTNLVTGYKPVILNRQNIDGTSMLSPYNLVTTYYWVYEDSNGNERPVRSIDLAAAWLANGSYAPEVMEKFDANQDGHLSDSELVIDKDDKRALIENRLAELGLTDPRIVGEVQPYSINHNVTRGEWAVDDCQTCHSDNSRMANEFQLSSYSPVGTIPEFVGDANVSASGELHFDESGALYYRPATSDEDIYIFGKDRVKWIDWFGGLFFLGTLTAVAGHSGLRFVLSIRRRKAHNPVEKIYMYHTYERLWHWLQTLVIVLLIFTGLVIHRPDQFGLFSFRHMVSVHNVMAAILVVNAALSLFYHLASGEIRQFIPRPYGFFDQAILQAKFYLAGIFKGDAHPFEKTPGQKMNPLQQATYFGILNVLLPLQIITGALMWGFQQWPEIASLFGGLPLLAPTHTLIAWTFAAFIVGHVYLTTTGHEPLAGIKGMVTGWEEIELPELTTDEEN